MNYTSPLKNCYDDDESTPNRFGRCYGPSKNLRNEREFGGPSNSNTLTHLQDIRVPRRDHPYQPRYTDQFKPNSYPRELTELFGAVECKLCEIEVTSPIVAKMHYHGKQHLKKVKTFLQNWGSKTGNPVPECDQSGPSSSDQTLADYCEICDMRLVSINDKVLHYSGRNHRNNELDPRNAKKRKMTNNTVDKTGRFGIGTDFAPAVKPIEEKLPEKFPRFECNICDVQAVSLEQLNIHLGGRKHLEKLRKQESSIPAYGAVRHIGEQVTEMPPRFECEMCDVQAVSLEQLQIHLGGKKHLEKLKKKESSIPKRVKPFPCDLCDISLETQSLYLLHVNGQKHKKRLLKQNPNNSGPEYCEVCKLNFNSSEQYEMHITGKKHEKKSKKIFNSNLSLNYEPVSLVCKYCPFVGNTLNHKCDGSLKKQYDSEVNSKFVCVPCHNMAFENEQEYKDHMTSQRHMLCVLNTEDRDRVVNDFYYCTVCNKQCENNRDYTEHTLGEEHFNKAKQIDLLKNEIYYCSVCEVQMDGKTKEEHMRDNVHLMKALLNDTKQTLATMAHNVSATTTSFRCNNCDVTLRSFVKYSEHLLSMEHADRLINQKLKQSVKPYINL